MSGKTSDITGGLPRVTELFEARNPSNPAVVVEIDGIVEYGKIKRGNREIAVKARTGEEKKYLIPLSKHILVQDGDFVRAGMQLSDGAISPGDILRLIFSGSKFTKLPDKTVASEYLAPDQWARLSALGTAHEEDYTRQSFLLTSFQMLRKELRFNRDTGADASDVVEKAADKADVPTTRAGTLRGEDILDALADAPPSAHIPCLTAAMDAVEAGPQIVEERATNWRRYKIPAVMANPLESALGKCWPWADETIGTELRTIWVDRIAEASAAKGTTLAVVPLRVLAEGGGVLDQLELRGFDIAGPPWK
jgi:hypothetical protein